MVVYCSVPQCRTYANEPGVSFHFYPKRTKLRERWLSGLKVKTPSVHSRVCSKHFREEDFVYAVGARMHGWRRRWLDPEAVPSQNLPILPLDQPRGMQFHLKLQQPGEVPLPEGQLKQEPRLQWPESPSTSTSLIANCRESMLQEFDDQGNPTLAFIATIGNQMTAWDQGVTIPSGCPGLKQAPCLSGDCNIVHSDPRDGELLLEKIPCKKNEALHQCCTERYPAFKGQETALHETQLCMKFVVSEKFKRLVDTEHPKRSCEETKAKKKARNRERYERLTEKAKEEKLARDREYKKNLNEVMKAKIRAKDRERKRRLDDEAKAVKRARDRERYKRLGEEAKAKKRARDRERCRRISEEARAKKHAADRERHKMLDEEAKALKRAAERDRYRTRCLQKRAGKATPATERRKKINTETKVVNGVATAISHSLLPTIAHSSIQDQSSAPSGVDLDRASSGRPYICARARRVSSHLPLPSQMNSKFVQTNFRKLKHSKGSGTVPLLLRNKGVQTT